MSAMSKEDMANTFERRSMETKRLIVNGETALGIELGSTRIKAVLIDFKGKVLAVGIHDWENSFVDNIWTYSLEEIHTGIRKCYSSLRDAVERQYGVSLQNTGAIGVSSQTHSSLKEEFKGLTGQAWILFLLNLFYFSLYVVRSTTVIYYFKYNLGKTEWLSLVGILGILSGLPMLLLLPALEKKYSKRSLMFFSIILYIAGDLLIYIGRSQTVCLLTGLVITGLGIYGIFGVTFAMQPDVIDYSEYKKNASVAGLIAALGIFCKGWNGIDQLYHWRVFKKRRICGQCSPDGKSPFVH